MVDWFDRGRGYGFLKKAGAEKAEIFIHASHKREQHLVLVIDTPHEQWVLSNSVDRLMAHADFVLKGWMRKVIQKLDPKNPESLAWMRRKWIEWEAT